MAFNEKQQCDMPNKQNKTANNNNYNSSGSSNSNRGIEVKKTHTFNT